MKSWLVLLAASLIVFLSSAAHTEQAKAEAGHEAPALVVSNSAGVVKLSALRGKYVVINFWNSADPQSRINNALFDRALADSDSGIEYIAICTDSTPELFGCVLEADGLREARQFIYDRNLAGTLLSDYCAPGESATYLIDPETKVVTMSADEIMSVIKSAA